MPTVDDTVNFTIDGVEYKLTLLCTSRAFLTGQEIMKLILPSAGAAVDGLFSEDLIVDNQTYATVAMLVTNQMGNVDMLAIIKELTAGLTANNIPVDFENYFKRKLNLLVDIIEVAMRENYGSLFTSTSLIHRLVSSMKELQNQTRPEVEETQTTQQKS